MMQNLSKAERERQIKALMEQTGKKEDEISAIMEVEQLREDANQRQVQDDEKPPEIEMAKPFSYNSKEEEPKGLYNGQVDDGYTKSGAQSQFEQIKNEGKSEFEELRKEGMSEYSRIVGNDKGKGPVSDYH